MLITGGAGYIGRVLIESAPKDWKITVLDNLMFGNSQFVPPNGIDFIKGDIRDETILDKITKATDAIIHLAGIVGAASYKKNPTAALEINCKATEKIIELTRKHKKKLVFMSTCSAYGFNPEICTEETTPNPVDEYSVSKIISEKDIQERLEDYTIFRLGTVYGWSPRMRFDLIINRIIEKKLWNEAIEIFGGMQWRPFIHVRDAAKALALAVDKQTESGIMNLVGENYQILDVAKQITDNLRIIPEREDNRSYRADNAKIKRILNWNAEMTITKTVQEFKKLNYNERIYHNHEWNYS